MEPIIEGQEPQKTPEDVVTLTKAEADELRMKAEASAQNYERLKKIELEKKELEARLTDGGNQLDASALKKEIDDKVDLRLAGFEPEHIAEIEKYAKGAGVSLSEAAKSPFIAMAVEAHKAKAKSTASTPAPSAKIQTFNGKPVEQIFKEGTPDEKQAAFMARMKGVKQE